jgi:hypothetical protein
MPQKNPAAVTLGKLRAEKGPSMAEIGALGGAVSGKSRAKPTRCDRCKEFQPSAREAWVHCRKPRAKSKRVEPTKPATVKVAVKKGK